MGESRRRKKILGSEYGKPKRNSQAAISSPDQTQKKIKRTEASRLPIPELEYLKLKLNSVELRDWLVNEWNSFHDFRVSVAPEDAISEASQMLDRLSSKFPKCLNSDPTICYAFSPFIHVSVGVNVYDWTVWASVGNPLKSICITSDDDEFELI